MAPPVFAVPNVTAHPSTVHGTAPAYLSDSLRPTSEIVVRRCLRSADITTLQVPSTRRATLNWRPRLSGGCSAGMEQSATRDSGLLLTFDIPKGDQVSPFSSVIQLTWRSQVFHNMISMVCLQTVRVDSDTPSDLWSSERVTTHPLRT